MTPAQILPDLSPSELNAFADWLRCLPLSAYATQFIYETVKDLSFELSVLADLRRQT